MDLRSSMNEAPIVTPIGTPTKMATSPSNIVASSSLKLASACFFGISSIVIVFVNKIVLTNYKFPSFFVLGIGQMVATVIVISFGEMLGIIKVPPFTRDTPKKVFPLPLIYVLNLVSGLGGTKKLNLPMFTVLRRFSIFLTMVFEFFILGTRPSIPVQASVMLMIGGAFVAALWDLAFDAVGYTLIFINDVCTAGNNVYIKQKLDAKDLGQYGLLFYNALLMLPPALLIAYLTGDLHKAYYFEDWTNKLFVAQFLLSCVCGFILNFAIVLCTKYNSALTTTCVGPIKNLVVTYGGMIVSGDYIFSVTNFIGINISVLGSIIYTYIVFRTKKPQQKVIQRIPESKQNLIKL